VTTEDSQELFARIEALTMQANGRRAGRVVGPGEILHDLKTVLGGKSFATSTGGSARGDMADRLLSTVSLVARHSDGRIGIGANACGAYRPYIGKAWPMLTEHLDKSRRHIQQRKLDEWVEQAPIVLGEDGAWWPTGPATLVERELALPTSQRFNAEGLRIPPPSVSAMRAGAYPPRPFKWKEDLRDTEMKNPEHSPNCRCALIPTTGERDEDETD